MLDIRPLVLDDIEQTFRLSGLAFGHPYDDIDDDDRAHFLRPGVDRWGAFVDGRLVAKVTDLHHGQWWGGRVVPTSGVAGVAVEAEQRGTGVASAILTHTLRAARDRGASHATLYPTTTHVYRSVGFEATGIMRDVALPTAALGRIARPAGIRLRAGDGKDLPNARSVYDAYACGGNGLLTREGVFFTAADGGGLPDGVDGLTLAEDAGGRIVGYMPWQRGKGYHADGYVHAHECIALTADAAAALLSSLGGWGSVAPTVRLRVAPWVDAVSALLPWERLTNHRAEIWMHRPLDAAAAVAARGWPAGISGRVGFRLVDPLLDWNDRAWSLELADGDGRLEPAADEPGATLDVRGWSLLWAGAARTPQLRQAGLLTGPADQDAALDLLLGSGGPSGLLDYF